MWLQAWPVEVAWSRPVLIGRWCVFSRHRGICIDLKQLDVEGPPAAGVNLSPWCPAFNICTFTQSFFVPHSQKLKKGLWWAVGGILYCQLREQGDLLFFSLQERDKNVYRESDIFQNGLVQV